MSANEIVNPAETQEIFTHRNEENNWKTKTWTLPFCFHFNTNKNLLSNLNLTSTKLKHLKSFNFFFFNFFTFLKKKKKTNTHYKVKNESQNKSKKPASTKQEAKNNIYRSDDKLITNAVSKFKATLHVHACKSDKQIERQSKNKESGKNRKLLTVMVRSVKNRKWVFMCLCSSVCFSLLFLLLLAL